MSKSSERAVEFSQMAETLAAAPDDEARLKVTVDYALTLVDASTHAAIVFMDKDHSLVTQSTNGEVAYRANALQQELREGPCFDVGADGDVISITDLSRDLRWPLWSLQASTDLGLGSMLTLLMFKNGRSTAALTLYAERDHAFDPDDVELAQAFTRQAVTGLTNGRQIEGLGTAMQSRLAIGQAEGIVMERLDVNEHQAFEYLRRISSYSNRKIVEIARDIVATRTLPDIDS